MSQWSALVFSILKKMVWKGNPVDKSQRNVISLCEIYAAAKNTTVGR